MVTNKGQRRCRCLFKFIIVIGVLGVGLGWAWPRLGGWLVQQDPAAPSVSHIMILMGDSSTVRADRGLELWQKWPEASIVLASEREGAKLMPGMPSHRELIHRAYLLSRGVPEERITILTACAATSTVEEAQCARTYLERLEAKPKDLHVVTSWSHSRRAKWLFDRVFRGSNVAIHMNAADPSSRAETWWREEADFLDVYIEYLKVAYWLFRGVGA